HFAQLREAPPDSTLDDVFEFDRAERHHVRRDDEWSAPTMGNFINGFRDRLRENAAGRFDKSSNRFGRSFTHAHGRLRTVAAQIHTAHASLRGERYERRLQFVHFPRAPSKFLFAGYDN